MNNFLVVDHIEKSKGNVDSNLQTLCGGCNNRKSARSMFTLQVMDAVHLLGHPAMSYPSLTKVVGIEASVFLSQLIYWTPRTNKHHNGWIYKTSTEVLEETGLSYKEQATAREKLLKEGLLEERHDRQNHRMLFRVVPSGIKTMSGEQLPEEQLLDEHMLQEQLPEEQEAIAPEAVGNIPRSSSFNISKSTTENTTEITVPPPARHSQEKVKPLFSYRIFESRYYSLTGFTPKRIDLLVGMYSKLCTDHGEDAVLKVLVEWVEVQGGEAALHKHQWGPKNFLEQAEVMLTTPRVRNSDIKEKRYGDGTKKQDKWKDLESKFPVPKEG